MKIAISLPDELSERIDALAVKKGMSRSALYVKAMEDYLSHSEFVGVKEALDAVYSDCDSKIDDAATALQAYTLHRLDKW